MKLKQSLSAVLGVLLLAGCASPIRNLANDAIRGPQGTVSLSIPHMASWAQQALKKSSKEPSRAFIVADSVVVEVKTAGGSNVIAPTTFNLTVGEDYYPGTPTLGQTVSGIPVGTNYTIVVKVFNKAVSTTSPVVQGQTVGVNIVANVNTPITVFCIPTSPTAISVNGPKQTGAIASLGERWYSLAVTSGQSYYIIDGTVSYALFDGSGHLISYDSAALFPYTATSTGTVYIGAVNGAASTYNDGLQVASSEPVLNEGSIGSPVLLTLNSPHTFLLGPDTLDDYAHSYYTFTTTGTDTYNFETGIYAQDVELYTDSGFTNRILSEDNDYGVSLGSLGPGTYYVKLSSNTSRPFESTGSLMNAAEVAAQSKNEGTTAAPLAVALNSTHAAQVGWHSFDKTSYYSFETGTGQDYSIVLSGAPTTHWFQIELYTAPGFSGSRTVNTYLYEERQVDVQLAPNTTYYFAVTDENSSAVTPFGLTVQTVSSPSVSEGSVAAPVHLDLDTAHTFKAGVYGSGYESYYSFTTTDTGTYAFDSDLDGIDFVLYSSSDFTGIVSSGYEYGGVFEGLSASTTYYLRLRGNSSQSKQSGPGRILTAATMAADFDGQGSKAAPTVVTVGTPFAGKIGKHTYDGTSYYKFVTGASGTYSLDFSHVVMSSHDELEVWLYSSSNLSYPSQVKHTWIDGDDTLTVSLDPATTYYLVVASEDLVDSSTETTFTLEVN